MGICEIIENKQIGLWKWLHKNGKLYNERIYNDGKLIEIKSCFDKNGKILDCGKIINGNGKMLFHDIENVFSRKDYMNYFKDISSATASRDLKNAVENGIISKTGDKKTTTYKKN